MNNRKYKIYVHIVPNGKLYIGQTKLSLNDRWGHKGNGYKEQLFYRAIQKYGWNNIRHLLLIDNLSHKEANIIETELIKKYNTTNIDFGYNLSLGGESGAKPQKIYQYNLDGSFIREYPSVEYVENSLKITSRNIRSCICQNEDKSDFTTRSAGGYLWSYIKADNIKPFKDIRKNKIYRYDLNGKYIDCFNSAIEAANTLNNVTATSIYSCLRGASKSGSGFMWTKYKKDCIKPYGHKKKKSPKRLCVYQYDLQGKYITSFNYVTEASKKYNVNPETIRSCCVYKNISACGYMWSYKKSEYIKPYTERIKEKSNKKIMIRNIPIYQYDKNNNLINKYKNATIASNNTGININGITQCCKGILKSSGGYVWKYAV